MKNLLIFLAAVPVLSLTAQTMQIKNMSNNQVVAPNAVIDLLTSPEGNTKITFDVKNTSNSTKTYNAKRYDALINIAGDTATAYFCFGGYCYGWDTYVSPNTITLLAGESASDSGTQNYMLTADLDESIVIGKSIVKYTFFNPNTAGDSIQITLRYNNTLGMNTLNKDLVSCDVFPNPAFGNAFLMINSIRAFEAKINVVNLLGAVLSEQTVNIDEGKNSIDLTTNDLSAGVYFVNIIDHDASLTKRLIVR